MAALDVKGVIVCGHSRITDDALLPATVEENVLAQRDIPRTHPSIAAKLVRREVRLHGRVYEIETGEVWSYDREKGRFVPLDVALPVVSLPKARSRLRAAAPPPDAQGLPAEVA